MTGKPTPPGVWAIDAAAGGTVCAIDAAKLSVWRAEPMAAGSMTITRRRRWQIGGTVAFAAGQARLPIGRSMLPAAAAPSR